MSTPVPVTLIFEGVLVGRHDETAKVYEMGVLPVPSHSFSITIKDHWPIRAGSNEPPRVQTDTIPLNETEITLDDSRWQLEIPGSAEKPSASLFRPGPAPDRIEDFLANEFTKKLDYRWVINLDKDLPGHKPQGAAALPRHEGLLRPVLNITVGEFYASQLFPALVKFRQGGKGEHQKFGFVPQQVAADFTLDAGGDVLVKKMASGDPVFRLPVRKDHSYEIFFRNTPPDDQGRASATRAEDESGTADVNRPTHFQLLYLLYNVPPEKRYELRVLPTDVTPVPNIEALAIAKEFLEARPRRFGVPNPRCSPVGE